MSLTRALGGPKPTKPLQCGRASLRFVATVFVPNEKKDKYLHIMRYSIVSFLLAAVLFLGCKKDRIGTMVLEHVSVGGEQLKLDGEVNEGLPIDRSITLLFSQPVNQSTATSAVSLVADGQPVNADIGFASQGKAVVIYPVGVLRHKTTYTIQISGHLVGADGSTIGPQQISFTTVGGALVVEAIEINGNSQEDASRITEAPLTLDLVLRFSAPLDAATVQDAVRLSGSPAGNLRATLSADKREIHLATTQPLAYLTRYTLTVSDGLKDAEGQAFSGLERTLYTDIDPEPKFPVISDEALLTLVQEQTFKYFWDFAHPESGMARERNTAGNTVTSGGSGFGIMALVVGMERGFITRAQGLARMENIVSFLENSDRFHGAWSHWLHGSTGAALPFSANDNGGDLVETALLVQGLITFRQYLDRSAPAENALAERINVLWEGVDWDWYRRGGREELYWHWSPDKGWAMNLQINGWNESLITYVLAAASPTHSIPKSVYDNGWARNGNMRNGNSFEGTVLPLGPNYGGPLFFSHYSFLGLDPRNLSDAYADYWTQNVNHTLINYKYSVTNPNDFVGYGENCWGLTASDGNAGYSAHSPTNDRGVISPTAALSSFPYTPEQSMKALKFFYYTMGDRLWGPYGFYDAFNITEGWVANSNIAIDQGPIILMIENYRTGLLWDLFMSAPEIQAGLTKLGFSY